jgi:hypothetical protein
MNSEARTFFWATQAFSACSRHAGRTGLGSKTEQPARRSPIAAGAAKGETRRKRNMRQL